MRPIDSVLTKGNKTADQRSTKSLIDCSNPKLPVLSRVGTSGVPIFKAAEIVTTINPANVSSKMGGNLAPIPSSRFWNRRATNVPATMDSPIWIANTTARKKASLAGIGVDLGVTITTISVMIVMARVEATHWSRPNAGKWS